MSSLDEYRAEVDSIDEQIMTLLAKRQAQIIKMAHLKAKKKMTAFQPDRHNIVIESRKQQAVEHGLNPEMVAIIWQTIMQEAIRLQEEIA